MTSTDFEPRQIDSERVDDGHRQWPIVLLTLLVGLLVGALVGGIYGATRPTTYEASTALSVQPDPTIDITSSSTSQNSAATLDATAYIQSQLVVINGAQLADQVRDALHLSARPDVSATQVGQTYVVTIVASADTAKGAVAIARQTGARYIASRTSELRSEIKGLLTSTNQQLSSVSKSLVASQRGRSANSALTPSQTALQTEYERLLSVRSTLNADLAQADGVVTVVSPSRSTSATLSDTVKDTLGGAIGGAVLALVIFFALRRSRHRIRSLADLAALDVPVVLPVQPRRSAAQLRRGDVWSATEARVLGARLLLESGADRRPLVFAGSGPAVGTTTVARSVAAALAGFGPVLLVEAGVDDAAPDSWAQQDLDSPSLTLEGEGVVRSSVPGVWALSDDRMGQASSAGRLIELIEQARILGWRLVVDAGSITQSSFAVRCAQAGAVLVLVVGRGRSTPSAVLSAAELFEASGTGMVGAVLNDTAGLRGMLSGRRKTAPTDPTEPTSAPTASRDRAGDGASLASVADTGTGDARQGAAPDWSEHAAGLADRTVR